MKGFSLVEMLVVVGITVILSSLLLAYNRSSDNLVLLGVEQAKVAEFLNRAKAFALERNLAKGGANVCAFGVHFSRADGAMVLFRTVPDEGGTCTAMLEGAGSSEVERVVLDARMEFKEFSCAETCDVTYDVAFNPPYLVIANPGAVTLGLKGRGEAFVVEIGSGGEINTRAL